MLRASLAADPHPAHAAVGVAQVDEVPRPVLRGQLPHLSRGEFDPFVLDHGSIVPAVPARAAVEVW
ncbi:hypothetical protein ACLQ3I_02755 [Gordonia sp. DT101]